MRRIRRQQALFADRQRAAVPDEIDMLGAGMQRAHPADGLAVAEMPLNDDIVLRIGQELRRSMSEQAGAISGPGLLSTQALESERAA